VGYDFATNYLVQKDYGSGDYFMNKASSTDIKDFTNSMSNPYGTEIYGQYTLNTSTAFDGSKNGITDFNKFACCKCNGYRASGGNYKSKSMEPGIVREYFMAWGTRNEYSSL
jgi:hypothetical protein